MTPSRHEVEVVRFGSSELAKAALAASGGTERTIDSRLAGHGAKHTAQAAGIGDTSPIIQIRFTAVDVAGARRGCLNDTGTGRATQQADVFNDSVDGICTGPLSIRCRADVVLIQRKTGRPKRGEPKRLEHAALRSRTVRIGDALSTKTGGAGCKR